MSKLKNKLETGYTAIGLLVAGTLLYTASSSGLIIVSLSIFFVGYLVFFVGYLVYFTDRS